YYSFAEENTAITIPLFVLLKANRDELVPAMIEKMISDKNIAKMKFLKVGFNTLWQTEKPEINHGMLMLESLTKCESDNNELMLLELIDSAVWSMGLHKQEPMGEEAIRLREDLKKYIMSRLREPVDLTRMGSLAEAIHLIYEFHKLNKS
ncbi:hypothetical protein ACFL54_09230, partial [Planctomycetota bacterium]